MRFKKTNGAQAGFSMVEVVIVVAIIMIISAMAAPNIISSLRLVKLRGATSSMINLFEQARMLAVRNNRAYMVLPAVAQGTTYWYIDSNVPANQTMDPGEPAVALPQSVIMAAAPPSNASMNPNQATNYYFLPAQTGPAFNSRGLPCYSTGPSCSNYVLAFNNYENFAYFIQDNGFGGTLYMAVTVGPNGKMKAWNWNGATWK